MPGYLTKLESVAITGVENLDIRSLLDRQQYHDPADLAARLGISSAAWPLFGLVWPSGLQLAAQLALRPVRPDEKILEIGCGLALASLVGHRRGARMTASDCHPLAGSFLEHNTGLNGLADITYLHGQWGAPLLRPDDLPFGQLTGRFDLIVGSDVLYERSTPAPLAEFIDHHALPEAEVWIVDPNRGNRPAFNRHMAERGFSLMRDKRLPGQVRLACGTLENYKGRILVYRREA